MRNGDVEYTSVDELITELQKISKDGRGDYPVCVNGASPVSIGGREWYYDGGYLVRDATKGKYDYLRSRPRDENGNGSRRPHPDVKECCYDIDICDPTWNDRATIDGRTVRDMDVETWSFLDKKEQEEIATFGSLVKYKLSPIHDKRMACHPFTAYLDSGENAIGRSMHEAKEKLKEQFLK